MVARSAFRAPPPRQFVRFRFAFWCVLALEETSHTLCLRFKIRFGAFWKTCPMQFLRFGLRFGCVLKRYRLLQCTGSERWSMLRSGCVLVTFWLRFEARMFCKMGRGQGIVMLAFWGRAATPDRVGVRVLRSGYVLKWDLQIPEARLRQFLCFEITFLILRFAFQNLRFVCCVLGTYTGTTRFKSTTGNWLLGALVFFNSLAWELGCGPMGPGPWAGPKYSQNGSPVVSFSCGVFEFSGPCRVVGCLYSSRVRV